MTEKTASLLYFFFQHTYIFPSSLSYIFTFPPPPYEEERDMSDPQTVPLPFHVFSLCGKPTPPLLLSTVQRTPQLFPPPTLSVLLYSLLLHPALRPYIQHRKGRIAALRSFVAWCSSYIYTVDSPLHPFHPPPPPCARVRARQ